MAWQSTLILERSIHQSAFNPQIWWFKWVIPISAALVLLQSFGELIAAIQKLRGKGVQS
jgi:TRAP-type mannitol/chloroaromatic compound transport system permease small subunit